MYPAAGNRYNTRKTAVQTRYRLRALSCLFYSKIFRLFFGGFSRRSNIALDLHFL